MTHSHSYPSPLPSSSPLSLQLQPPPLSLPLPSLQPQPSPLLSPQLPSSPTTSPSTSPIPLSPSPPLPTTSTSTPTHPALPPHTHHHLLPSTPTTPPSFPPPTPPHLLPPPPPTPPPSLHPHPPTLLPSTPPTPPSFLHPHPTHPTFHPPTPTTGVEFSCLGNWYVGKNHYFAVVNTKESRKEEKYRCFVRNREDDLYLGHSLTPECSVLKTPENSPVRFRLSYAKHEEVTPGCLLPRNMTGKWISTGAGEPEVTINSTHISESTWRGYSTKTANYVCLQQRGNRYLTAKLSPNRVRVLSSSPPPQHHPVQEELGADLFGFPSVRLCKFQEWAGVERPLLLRAAGSLPPGAADPRGGHSSPLDTYRCHRRITEMAVCDEERKWIVIDTDRCITLNKDGHPVDFNSVSDYRLQCVGYWKENLLSYLVTYDPSDSASRFRCWVYLRIGETKLRLSQSVGAACGLNQTFLSSTYEESAAVALNLTFEERLYDQCPMYYDDGSDPWRPTDTIRTVFRFTSHNPSVHGPQILVFILPVMTLL
ncbi:hypothetical protein C7M84_018558, partial [Penaeus vannamei]